jgi:hypothetical protein
MIIYSNILTGAFLTLASVPGWTGDTEQPRVTSKEPPRLALIWQDEDAGRLVSDYQGEID